MKKEKRISLKWLLLGALFILIAIYFGGGLWGWGGGKSFEEVKRLKESTPAELQKKLETLASLNSSSEQKQEIQSEQQRLRKILDAWAEDAYLSAQSKIENYAQQGKKAEARAVMDRIPKEYWSSSFGPKLEELRRRVDSL